MKTSPTAILAAGENSHKEKKIMKIPNGYFMPRIDAYEATKFLLLLILFEGCFSQNLGFQRVTFILIKS